MNLAVVKPRKTIALTVADLRAQVEALSERIADFEQDTYLPKMVIKRRTARRVIGDLVKSAARIHGVGERDIMSKTHERKIAWARQWVMFEASQKKITQTLIAEMLHRDHTTVAQGIRAEAARRTAK